MERIVKVLTIIFAALYFCPQVLAEIPPASLVTPQTVSFDICTKNYNLTAEKLFYLSIASAKANRFTIDEIQSKTGYILFTVSGKQYLASVIKEGANSSQLKITPTNNNYFFAPGIVLNFFKYIDLNLNTQLITLPKNL